MNINYTTEHLRIHMSRNVLVEMDLLLAEEKKKVRLLKEIGREMRTLLAGEKQKVLRLQQCCIGFKIALSIVLDFKIGGNPIKNFFTILLFRRKGNILSPCE